MQSKSSLATEVVLVIRNNLNHLSEDEKLYLYGNDSISDSDNKAILKFLKDILKLRQEKKLIMNLCVLQRYS